MSVCWRCELPRFGDAQQFSAWLREQQQKCSDTDFGRRFADACPVPGLKPAAYQHRELQVGGETLLVGIRFKGGDVAQPFVDLLAWSGEPRAEWRAAIRNAFSSFNPWAVRFCWPAHREPAWPAEVDQYVYAGPANGAPQAKVTPARDLSWFDDFRRSFAHWQQSSSLGTEVRPAEADELRACLADGHVVVASSCGSFLGVAACRWQTERAFAGWAIVEQFVILPARGRGLGTALQRGLMQNLPTEALVWGTIHGRNAASQATARRCGRTPVETWWFAPL